MNTPAIHESIDTDRDSDVTKSSEQNIALPETNTATHESNTAELDSGADGLEPNSGEQASDTVDSRANIEHSAAFDPTEVQAGDTIAGLEVKSIRTGESPTSYVIVELEGELVVDGYYYHTGATVHFQPDLPSLEKLPHVKDAYVLHYREGKEVPRMPRFIFDISKFDALASTEAGIGYATMVLSDYTVQYVPEKSYLTSETVIQEGHSYIELGEELLPIGFQYVEDDATPIEFTKQTEVHIVTPPEDAILDENGQFIWNGLTVRKELLTAWFSSEDELNASFVGNHASLMRDELLSLPGIGDAHLLVVERDKWDDSIGYYNGVEYEYWIVVLREDPMVRLAGDDYMHAFCLIGVTDQQSEAAEKHIQELASSQWVVPPEDFYQ